jgi:hypothetical protein
MSAEGRGGAVREPFETLRSISLGCEIVLERFVGGLFKLTLDMLGRVSDVDVRDA